MVFGVSEHPLMATSRASTSVLPWIWVIETLASSNQVDVTLLIDLVKKIQEISGDSGKSAREIVSLRIIESLLTGGNRKRNNSTSVAGPKIRLDPSECCEDVLRKIMNEASLSELKKAGPEILKWDVQSFVSHKRSTLPRCTLQQLKEMILKDNNHLMVSLKEKSGLAITCQQKEMVVFDNPNSNGIPERLLGGNNSGKEVIDPNGEDIQDIIQTRTLLPAKRSRCVTSAKTQGGLSHEIQVTLEKDHDNHMRNSKKFKHDVIPSKKVDNTVLSRVDSPLAKSSERIRYVEAESCNLEKGPQIGSLEHGMKTNDGRDASKGPGQDNAFSSNGSLHYQQQVLNSPGAAIAETAGERQRGNKCANETMINNGTCAQLNIASSSGTPGVVIQQSNSVDEAEDNNNEHNASKAAISGGAKVDCNHNHEPESSSDSDGYLDERINIATRKNAFLNSQCTNSQDSLATTDCRELKHCVKCNKSGQLLNCSTNTCPLVVHDRCLGSVACFDKRGKFYCPFCAYSRAISRYLTAKRNASLARKDLAAFIGFEVAHQKEKPTRSRRLKQIQERQSAVSCELNEEENNKKCEENEEGNDRTSGDGVSSGAYVDDRQEAGPSVSRDDARPPIGLVSKPEEEKVEQEYRSTRGQEEKQIAVICTDLDNRDRSKTDAEVRMEEPVSHKPRVDISRESVDLVSTDAEEISEEDEKSGASKYSIRFRAPGKKYTYPAYPQLRRKKLPWTKIEEQTLKDGVQRFSSGQDKSIPWKKILEFGGDVFQKGRTTVDLKDKWRNICKGGAKIE